MNLNFFDFFYKLFDALQLLATQLWAFLTNNLGQQIINAPLFRELLNFKIFGFKVFEGLSNIISTSFNYSIIDALPVFIIVGLLFAVLYQFLP